MKRALIAVLAALFVGGCGQDKADERVDRCIERADKYASEAILDYCTDRYAHEKGVVE